MSIIKIAFITVTDVLLTLFTVNIGISKSYNKGNCGKPEDYGC